MIDITFTTCEWETKSLRFSNRVDICSGTWGKLYFECVEYKDLGVTDGKVVYFRNEKVFY